MDRQDYLNAESSSLPGNICLSVFMKLSSIRAGLAHTFAKISGLPFSENSSRCRLHTASRVQRPDKNKLTASNKRQREERCMGEGRLSENGKSGARRVNINCVVSDFLHSQDVHRIRRCPDKPARRHRQCMSILSPYHTTSPIVGLRDYQGRFCWSRPS